MPTRYANELFKAFITVAYGHKAVQIWRFQKQI